MRRTMVKKLICALFIAVMVCGLFAGCAAPAQETPSPAPTNEPEQEKAATVKDSLPAIEDAVTSILHMVISENWGYPNERSISPDYALGYLRYLADCYAEEALPVEELDPSGANIYVVWDQEEVNEKLFRVFGGEFTANMLPKEEGIPAADGMFCFLVGDVGYSLSVRYTGDENAEIDPAADYVFAYEFQMMGSSQPMLAGEATVGLKEEDGNIRLYAFMLDDTFEKFMEEAESPFTEVEQAISTYLGTMLSTGKGYPQPDQMFCENYVFNYANMYLTDRAEATDAVTSESFEKFVVIDVDEMDRIFRMSGMRGSMEDFAADLSGSEGLQFADGKFYVGIGEVGFTCSVSYAGDTVSEITPDTPYTFSVDFTMPGSEEEGVTDEIMLTFAIDDVLGEMAPAGQSFGEAIMDKLTDSPFYPMSSRVDALLKAIVETGELYPGKGKISPEYASGYLFYYTAANLAQEARHVAELADEGFDEFVEMNDIAVGILLNTAFGPGRIEPDEAGLAEIDGQYFVPVGGDADFKLLCAFTGGLFQEFEAGKAYPVDYEIHFVGEEDRVVGTAMVTLGEFEDGTPYVSNIEADDNLKNLLN